MVFDNVLIMLRNSGLFIELGFLVWLSIVMCCMDVGSVCISVDVGKGW